MKALVVYESIFGNTELVARAVGEGISLHADVRVVEVGDAARVDGVDLVVVGGPTHAFGMTRPSTREDAKKQAGDPVVSQGLGIREWLTTMSPTPKVPVATFDTRVEKVRRIPGSAARSAARALHKQGCRLVAPPESFYVHDIKGPLLEGEIERARLWGQAIAANR